jgi:MFS family permease
MDSDRYGRRLILISGLFFSLIFQVLFGFSFSLPICMVFRFLSGAFNGNIGVAKTYLGEITDKSNQVIKKQVGFHSIDDVLTSLCI